MLTLIIIFSVLSIISLLPLGIDGGYSGGALSLNIKLGPIIIKLFPRAQKPKTAKPKKEKNVPSDEAQKEKSKKPMDKTMLLGIIKEGFRAISRFRRKLSIDYFRFHYVFASDDPFETAVGFGRASAVTGVFLPMIDAAFNVKQRDVGFSMDFLADKPIIDVWITATIQVWELIYIAGAFGIGFLKLKRKENQENRTSERNELNGKTSNR